MKNKDYFGLSYGVSLLLAIIPVTAMICAVVTRIQEGKIVAGILRIPFGWVMWLPDLICMIAKKHIIRFINA